MRKENRNRGKRGWAALLLALAALAGVPAATRVAEADVVLLRGGRAYAGIIERHTSETIQLYDGNLRRVIALGEVQQIIRERPDTSWLLVGDIMAKQRDWETAAEAYRNALEQTNQPEVLLKRLEHLRAMRFELPGADLARAALEQGEYKEAATALANLVGQSQGLAQKHYWANQLARAYIGLAERYEGAPPPAVNPYLVYALLIAPDSATAHARLGAVLDEAGRREAARQETLLALDLDPVEPEARSRLASMGVDWAYDAASKDRSGLRNRASREPALDPEGEPPLTTAALARSIRGAPADAKAVRLLLAAYLVEPNAALAYRGDLPYPDVRKTIASILADLPRTAETTPYDRMIIAAAIKYRIDPRFLRAVGRVRSGLKPEYAGPDGADRGGLALRAGERSGEERRDGDALFRLAAQRRAGAVRRQPARAAGEYRGAGIM